MAQEAENGEVGMRSTGRRRALVALALAFPLVAAVAGAVLRPSSAVAATTPAAPGCVASTTGSCPPLPADPRQAAAEEQLAKK